MLTNNKQLKGFTIRAKDGEIGTIEDLYFDDETWAIRYFTVETGSWLGSRQVLISPYSVLHTDLQARKIVVALTMEQVKNSPDINTQQPVSRQHEAEFAGYYGYPYYWGGPYLWGPIDYPTANILTPTAPWEPLPEHKTHADSHLRSTNAVSGYHIQAVDEEIGHVDSFLIDAERWAIRYLEVATKNWWPGKKVLVSPTWIERVSWEESKVFVALTRDAIKDGPEYTEDMPVNRAYENQLHLHYGRPPYWITKAASTHVR